MKLMKVKTGFNLIYYDQARHRNVNKFFKDLNLMLDFALEQRDLYIEFFDSDIREFATTHDHKILTMKSLIFA